MNKNRTTLINQVKSIILKHVKPSRIILYGSVANGESHQGSDIDIAYDAPGAKVQHLIDDDLETLSTLTKLDVKNIATCGERFRNRVMSTGRVLYSATKELRAEDGLHNFSNALDRFASVIDRKTEFERDGFGDVFLDLIVKRFEFTYEMAWKALKRYLEFLGLDPKAPRMVFKEAFAQQIITDEEVWLDMIEQRNLTSHVYDELEVACILERTHEYQRAFLDLKTKIMVGLDDDKVL